MAQILLIDTSASHTHVAIGTAENMLQERINTDPNQQAASLNEMIAALCGDAAISLQEIDAIAINAGPGSYTGLRVGLGVAKGLCFALDKPLMLFNKLDLVAAAYVTETPLLVVLKARTGEGFAIAIREGETLMPAQHIFYDTFDFDHLGAHTLLSDDPAIQARFPDTKFLESHILDMKLWNKQAQQRWQQREFDDLAYAEPFYLKAAFTTTPKNKF